MYGSVYTCFDDIQLVIEVLKNLKVLDYLLDQLIKQFLYVAAIFRPAHPDRSSKRDTSMGKVYKTNLFKKKFDLENLKILILKGLFIIQSLINGKLLKIKV